MLIRGALLVLKVIRQISRSHGTKIVDFDPNWAFPDCNSSFNSPMATKWCTKLEVAYKRSPIVLKVIRQISRSRGTKMADFDPNLAFPDCNSSLNWPIAMKWCKKLWSSLGEMPYCFSRSSTKFQGHTDKIWPILTRIWRFRTVTPV